jgi:hypothetical protein
MFRKLMRRTIFFAVAGSVPKPFIDRPVSDIEGALGDLRQAVATFYQVKYLSAHVYRCDTRILIDAIGLAVFTKGGQQAFDPLDLFYACINSFQRPILAIAYDAKLETIPHQLHCPCENSLFPHMCIYRSASIAAFTRAANSADFTPGLPSHC